MRPPKLVCAWCELNRRPRAEGEPEPFPHIHHEGQIPLTPCPDCSLGVHEGCHPGSPYFCTCDCGLKQE